MCNYRIITIKIILIKLEVRHYEKVVKEHARIFCAHNYYFSVFSSTQMSGGQRQRIGIARAISTKPCFIICDEPVSALDVSVQGQILNLLSNLKQELNLTYLFISHDLKVVKHVCSRIAVMYKGEIIEIGDTKQILKEPARDYTKKLTSYGLLY